MTENRKIAIEVRNNQHLDDKQKQLILGTLLGDGSMFVKGNGARGVQISHCDKQLQYLEWKKNILYPFIVAEKPAVSIGSYGFPGNCYRTIVHQDFTDIYGSLYRKIKGKSHKYISRKYLNELNVFGLLIWFMDDGSITTDKEARFATNGFCLSNQKVIKSWLWQRFKIESIISINSSNKSYFIRINVLNAKRLMRLFVEYIREVPACMQYKFRFHFNLNDYTLNCYALKDASRRYSLNTAETL